jgi:hypothetical protein
MGAIRKQLAEACANAVFFIPAFLIATAIVYFFPLFGPAELRRQESR